MPAHGKKSNMSGTKCKNTPSKIKTDCSLSQNRPMGRVVTTSNSLESHQNGEEGGNSNIDKQNLCNGYDKDISESKETVDGSVAEGLENKDISQGAGRCHGITNGIVSERESSQGAGKCHDITNGAVSESESSQGARKCHDITNGAVSESESSQGARKCHDITNGAVSESESSQGAGKCHDITNGAVSESESSQGAGKCHDIKNGAGSERESYSNFDHTIVINGFDHIHVVEDSTTSLLQRDLELDRRAIVNVERKERETGSGVNLPAARPKTISWSRTVKHRKELKEKGKKLIRKRVRENYVHPDIGSSSEESGEEFSTFQKSRSMTQSGSSQNLSNGVLPNLSSTSTSASSMECSDYLHRFSECYMEDSVENNSTCTGSAGITQANGINSVDIGFRYDHKLLQNNLILAPLALPEDSDGSSVSNGSDRAANGQLPDDRDDQAIVLNTNPLLPSQAENKCRIVAVDHVYVEDHFEVPKVSNFINVIPPLPNLSRRSSSESLEEIGDYIETDFPSRACRHMFQSSSHSSSLSTDSDEGYGVNEEPRLPSDVEGASYLPTSVSNPNNPSCLHNVLSCDTHPRNLSGNECYNLHVSTSANNSPALSPSSTLSSQLSKENCTKSSRTNRLDSITGRSEDGSDICGVIGSDSSLIYSPDNDFVEFTDSDVPVSASSATRFFPFSQGTEDDVTAPVNYDHVKYGRSPTDFSELSHLNSIQGAEGGATNDLNMYEFEEVDSNMELLDPHLLSVENGNYLYQDVCKHEKVPRANFQNSESNMHEKIYFKCTLEKESHSSESGSSDNEENLAYCLPREQLLNVGEEVEVERPPQNCEGTDCMVLEDLENLTHALQNAVIMHLPSKLEESSGDSSDVSEEPIYEDIDFLESLQVKGDNLHVVDEENSNEATAKVIPKYCRRGQRTVIDVEKVMIWNEYEAYVLQVKQIGTSACGPTAVLNVMKAFDCQVDKEELGKKIITNTRMETAPIPYYLFSRSSAGTTADSLIEGIYKLTRGAIRGRFFHFFPSRKVELLKWLGNWIKKGAVPIATLNLQRGVKPGWTIPDAWHHQMIYGVSSKGVYLTNPLEIVSEETMMEQLTSDSVLLVRRQDVVNRFRDWAPLNDLLQQRDPRWLTMNVLGQVVNVLREACTALYQQVPRYRAQMTSHVTIPAAYKAGITLFVRQNTEVAHQLFSAPELEIKDPPEAISRHKK